MACGICYLVFIGSITVRFDLSDYRELVIGQFSETETERSWMSLYISRLLYLESLGVVHDDHREIRESLHCWPRAGLDSFHQWKRQLSFSACDRLGAGNDQKAIDVWKTSQTGGCNPLNHLLDPPMLWFVYLGFGSGKRRNCGFIDGCFCKNFHAGFHRRVTEKTKAFLYEPHCLAFRSCISGQLELLHFFRLV